MYYVLIASFVECIDAPPLLLSATANLSAEQIQALIEGTLEDQVTIQQLTFQNSQLRQKSRARSLTAILTSKK